MSLMVSWVGSAFTVNVSLSTSLFTVYCSPFTVHRLLFTVHCSPFTVS